MIHELPLTRAPWQQLQQLLDQSFPLPPRDVFERVVQGSHRPQRLWIAISSDNGCLQGIVMLSPHSKGGHLENLAVLPAARGFGIGKALVRQLLQDSAANESTFISLTTRIPPFFISLGFKEVGGLGDGSVAMVQCLP